MFKKVWICMLIGILPTFVQSQDAKSIWADSLLGKMSTPEKIGQLMMLSASSYDDQWTINKLIHDIQDHHIGGIRITRGGPESHINLVNKLQSVSKYPLWIAMEAEWGAGQILDSIQVFPKPLLIGAAGNDSLSYKIGQGIGSQLKILGININFAPNADLDMADDSYPGSLNYYGTDKLNVARAAISMMKGMQQEGILSVVKELPNPKKKIMPPSPSKEVANLDLNQLDTIGFYPYQQLISSGADGILTSHLDFLAPSKKHLVSAPLSTLFIKEILTQKLSFTGLTFCEALYIKKISNKTRIGEAEKLAFEIGNDVIIDPSNLGKTISKIAKAVKKNRMLKNQLNLSVRKILEAKFSAGLNQARKTERTNAFLKLNKPEYKLISHQVAERAVTVIQNKNQIIPIKILESKRFVSICLGNNGTNTFNHYLSQYVPLENMELRHPADTVGIENKLKDHAIIIFSIFPSAELSPFVQFIRNIAHHNETILCNFSDPFLVRELGEVPVIIQGYTNESLVPEKTAQIIFGGLKSNGHLPFTSGFSEYQGINTPSLTRFSYTVPEGAGMDSRTLEKIKGIAQEAIAIGATPGCEILVAKDGKVVYQESFGSYTYENKMAVTNETIYDLASVTKVSATLQAVMFMHEKDLIDINKKISFYLPELKNTNKQDIIIKDILTHQAGLWPYLPFWSQTIKDTTLLPEYYSSEESEEYPFPVAEKLFAKKTMKDSLWQWVINAKIREKPPRTIYDYRYSDMGFYMMQRLAERLLNQPMDEFLQQNLYEPLGANTIGYLPRRKFPDSQIAPTENDKLFRRRLLKGYVHDQGAAMHGGVAGHAGLFSDAIDLAKLGQMWLQQGYYGGTRYFKPETITFFGSKQYETSRRGLGFDKPALGEWNGPTSGFASPSTFGHTGFTGTCIWVDPEYKLVYVFLSNRVYPDMNNNKILNANIRPRIQDVIYQSIFDYCQNH